MLPSNNDQVLEKTDSKFIDKNSQISGKSKASKKISQMNVLIVEKLSIIVSGYFQSIDKLQKYYQQIQSLVNYNKKLIDILEQFENHEEKLIKRLKKMQEINFQYMREYCQMKGKQFNLPAPPEHKSIFADFNLQQFETEIVQYEPPIVEISYKNQLINILKTYYLNKQQTLLQKVIEQLKKYHSEQQMNTLTQIKQMIEQYNTSIDNQIQKCNQNDPQQNIITQQQQQIDQKKKQDKIFELLRLRSEIRNKVQSFFDTNIGKSKIKPDYKQEEQFINKVINLHAKIEQMNEQAILYFLNQQKNTRNQIQKSRIEFQSQIQKENKSLSIQNREQKDIISILKTNYEQLYKQKQKIKAQSEQKIQQLNAGLDGKIVQLREKVQIIYNLERNQLSLGEQVGRLKKEQQRLRQQVARLSCKPNRNLSQITWDIFNVQQSCNAEIISKLQSDIASLQAEKTDRQESITKLQNQVSQLTQKIQAIQTYYKQQTEKLKKQLQKLTADHSIVQDLATKVYQAIQLIAAIQVNKNVKQKILNIKNNLQRYVKDYQKSKQWNIMTQAPAYFRDLSMITNIQQDEHQEFQDQFGQNRGYSFDLINAPQVRAKVENQPQQRKQKSLMIQRQIQISIIQNKPQASLNLSHQLMQQPNDDYNNLYKLYQQVIECLEMEQKKSKKLELEYQGFVQKIYDKEKLDPDKYSLDKQLVFLTKLTMEQKETIQTERKQYNQIFKNFHEDFKSNMESEMRSLRAQSFDMKPRQNHFL